MRLSARKLKILSDAKVRWHAESPPHTFPVPQGRRHKCNYKMTSVAAVGDSLPQSAIRSGRRPGNRH
jgi:hypothetical protein